MMLPHMLDLDEKEFNYKLSKTITLMPEEVQDRFKALKCLYVSTCHPRSIQKPEYPDKHILSINKMS